MQKNTLYQLLCLIIIIGGIPFSIMAQPEDTKQKVSAFVSSLSDDYEEKKFNLAVREIGSIMETNPEWHTFFQLRSKKKVDNSIGKKVKEKVYFNIFHFEDEKALERALKFWFQHFIEGQSIRPGRKLKVYDNAQPMYILAIRNELIILDMDCMTYHDKRWKEWQKTIKDTFDPLRKGIIIEIMCGGPLEWVQNAPDPRARN